MTSFNKRWIIKKHGNQNILYSNHSNCSGIDITINKRKKTLSIGGWYDSFVGIESQEISLQEVIDLFKENKK